LSLALLAAKSGPSSQSEEDEAVAVSARFGACAKAGRVDPDARVKAIETPIREAHRWIFMILLAFAV
jgi:hypothetical protein